MNKIFLSSLITVVSLIFFESNLIAGNYSEVKSKYFDFIKQKSFEVMKNGFSAGDNYNEIWIRDFNSFIELAYDCYGEELVKDNLRVFFLMQQKDGSILDGFVPNEERVESYDYIFSDLVPQYAGYKNTVETDQESSLIQATCKYVDISGDYSFLMEEINGLSVLERIYQSVKYLLNNRFSEEHGLIYGGTTADWGDVQPEHEWGVFLNEDSHFAIDIYDNAMILIALSNLTRLDEERSDFYAQLHKTIRENSLKHLWDEKNKKFIPNLYLEESPFSKEFCENKIYLHGGTAIAIEAGLLNKDQVRGVIDRMVENKKSSGANTIGLTLYPPYPAGFFKNPTMSPYSYQNGGDWTWFGGRMIQQMIHYGFIEDALNEVQPMFDRVLQNDGFYEWYTLDNEPEGSGVFKASAGVLYEVIKLLERRDELKKR
ncbi:GH36-type glycosyl hydrolase domain-containing protein [Marinilabilia salmonicolor]|uniref:GH36-type glycosyl hydrolase domain-containing protein n=1 Tax=Marinilabilia salmonicolor TaxID=989 RepID=UPI00029A248B|nr:amylo-alpha-1,6-glucosidase [Marinilabilia salmonicolor]